VTVVVLTVVVKAVVVVSKAEAMVAFEAVCVVVISWELDDAGAFLPSVVEAMSLLVAKTRVCVVEM
jgi:hypothetical protein